jgi:Mn-dependent DtxR family transcriptional regulator
VTAGETASDRAQASGQAIVDALATLEAIGLEATISTLAAWLGVHPKTKTLLASLGALRADGYLEGMRLTSKGLADAKLKQPSVAEQRAQLALGLTDSQRRIVDTIATLDALGRPVTHAALALWLGVHPKTKALLEDLGKVRGRGYLDGTTLTELGRRASIARYVDKKPGDLITCLDDSQRAIAECVLQFHVVPSITELASQLGVHPKTKSLLEGVGALRSRGIVTQGWPLRPTDVFPAVRREDGDRRPMASVRAISRRARAHRARARREHMQPARGLRGGRRSRASAKGRPASL